MEWIEWIVGVCVAVPQFVWGGLSTFMMTVVLPKSIARYRRAVKDQRKTLYRNIVTLLARPVGWLGQHGTNKISYGTTMVISWGVPKPVAEGEKAEPFDENSTLNVLIGGNNQAAILYEADKAAILKAAKVKLEKVVEEEVQNRGAGVNMFVGTLVSQST